MNNVFRKDIQGLRAWAVIAVLMFHFKIPGFSGGFAGVDVFFVISGFLMTAIIAGGLENKNFSFWRFYMARARRIIPALAALVTVLLIVGWFWLPTPDYKTLGSQSAYSLLFLSNIYFWRSAGYFDAAAHEKLLLHTWSLSVEWQFYLLFPLFLVILWKIRPGIKMWCFGGGLILLFVSSFVLSCIATPWKPTPAFYLLPTRAWEMAAGGLVFFAGRGLYFSVFFQKILEGLGWLLIAISFFLFSSDFLWPGGWALIPVAGTVLVMLANNQKSWISSSRLVQWIGTRSYSIYLWHWPLVVTLYYLGYHGNKYFIFMGILISFILGHFSYFFVEKPARIFLPKKGIIQEVFVFVIVLGFLGGASVAVRLIEFEGRLPELVEIAAKEATNKNTRRPECFDVATEHGSPGCVFGNDNKIKAILMGDSHAASVISAAGKAAEKYGNGVVFWGMDSCPTMASIKSTSRSRRSSNPLRCNNFNLWAFKELENYSEDIPLILVSRTSTYVMGANEPDRKEEAKFTSVYFSQEYLYRNDPSFQKEFKDVLVQTACKLAEKRPVYMMRPVPEMALDVPKTLSRNILLGRDNGDFTIPIEVYYERNTLVWEAQDEAAQKCGVKILNPLPWLCDELKCYGSRDGRPLYFDDDHLSEYGNTYLIPMFEEVFRASAKGFHSL